MTSKPPTETAPSAPNFTDRAAAVAKAAAKAAAIRVATTQFVKAVRLPIITLIAKQAKGDEGMLAAVASFMSTDLGESALSGLLAVALPHVPVPPKYQEKRDALVVELGVRALEGAGNVMAEFATGPLRDIVVAFLSGDPAHFGALPAVTGPLMDAMGAGSDEVMERYGVTNAPNIATATPAAAPSNPFLSPLARP